MSPFPWSSFSFRHSRVYCDSYSHSSRVQKKEETETERQRQSARDAHRVYVQNALTHHSNLAAHTTQRTTTHHTTSNCSVSFFRVFDIRFSEGRFVVEIELTFLVHFNSNLSLEIPSQCAESHSFVEGTTVILKCLIALQYNAQVGKILKNCTTASKDPSGPDERAHAKRELLVVDPFFDCVHNWRQYLSEDQLAEWTLLQHSRLDLANGTSPNGEENVKNLEKMGLGQKYRRRRFFQAPLTMRRILVVPDLRCSVKQRNIPGSTLRPDKPGQALATRQEEVAMVCWQSPIRNHVRNYDGKVCEWSKVNISQRATKYNENCTVLPVCVGSCFTLAVFTQRTLVRIYPHLNCMCLTSKNVSLSSRPPWWSTK